MTDLLGIPPTAADNGGRRPGNPFVGPRSIQRGEKIYGRDVEIGELRDLLISERIVLMYSPSGAGKTSLIDAGLRPELGRNSFWVLPTVRVGHDEAFIADVDVRNRYLMSALLSLEAGRPPERRLAPGELMELDFAGYLARISEDNVDEHEPCLVFDQFEELLTLDPTDQADKVAFLDEIGRALRDRTWWALFSMREDFVAQLDPYVRYVPTRFKTRYRLDLLSADAAKDVARKAAADGGVEFETVAAQALVDDLRRVQVQRGDEKSAAHGRYVEPVQLQVVCSQLWDRLPPGARAIGVDDVENLGDVDRALADYYETRVREVAGSSGASEREIREWFDEELLTDQGFRTQTLDGPSTSGPEVLRLLEHAHLIRAESRRGAKWFELSHDRLVEPIRTANSEWRAHHLSDLQLRAHEWDRHDRSPGLLIGGTVLAEAVDWARTHDDEVSAVDREYLEACRHAEETATRLRRSSRRNLILAIAAGLLAVLAVIGLAFALREQQEAEDARGRAEESERKAMDQAKAAKIAADQAKNARDREKDERMRADRAAAEATAAALAATSRAVQLENAALALAVAAESTSVTEEPLPATSAATAGARSNFRARTWQPVGDPIPQAGAREVAISPDGEQFVSAGCRDVGGSCGKSDTDGDDAASTLYVRSFDDPATVAGRLDGHDGQIWEVAFRPDGAVLASASGDGTVRVWDVASRDELAVLEHPIGDDADDGDDGDDAGALSGVNTVAFHPDDADMLVSGDRHGRVWMWDLATDPPTPTVLRSADFYDRRGWASPRQVSDIAFRSDGKLFASAESSGQVVLWWTETAEPVAELSYPSTETSPGLVDAAEPLEALRVAFAPETDPERCPETFFLEECIDALVVGQEDGDIWRWEIPNSETPRALRVLGHTDDVRGLSFDPSGTGVFASSSGDRTIRLWELTKLDDGSRTVSQVGQPLNQHSEFVSDVSFAPDGLRMVSTSEDNTLRIWGVPTVDELGISALGEPLVCDDPASACFATSVAFGPDDGWIVSGGTDGHLRLWDTATMAPAFEPVDVGEAIFAVAARADADLVVAGGHGRVWSWDAADPATVTVLWSDPAADAADDAAVRAVRAVAVDDATGLAAAADECGTIRVFDLAQRQLVGERSVTDDECPAVPLNGNWSVDALAFGEGVLYFGDESGRVGSMSFNADGQLGPPERVASHTGNVRGLAVSPDGRLLASGSRDQTVQLIDIETGDVLHVLQGHRNEVGAVAFGRDGSMLVSASNDGSTRLWFLDGEDPSRDVVPPTGEPLASSERCLAAVECFVLGIDISDDGTMLASAGSDGLVHVWDRPTDAAAACRLAAPFVSPSQLRAEIPDLRPDACLQD